MASGETQPVVCVAGALKELFCFDFIILCLINLSSFNIFFISRFMTLLGSQLQEYLGFFPSCFL